MNPSLTFSFQPITGTSGHSFTVELLPYNCCACGKFIGHFAKMESNTFTIHNTDKCWRKWITRNR